VLVLEERAGSWLLLRPRPPCPARSPACQPRVRVAHFGSSRCCIRSTAARCRWRLDHADHTLAWWTASFAGRWCLARPRGVALLQAQLYPGWISEQSFLTGYRLRSGAGIVQLAPTLAPRCTGAERLAGALICLLAIYAIVPAVSA